MSSQKTHKKSVPGNNMIVKCCLRPYVLEFQFLADTIYCCMTQFLIRRFLINVLSVDRFISESARRLSAIHHGGKAAPTQRFKVLVEFSHCCGS